MKSRGLSVTLQHNNKSYVRMTDSKIIKCNNLPNFYISFNEKSGFFGSSYNYEAFLRGKLICSSKCSSNDYLRLYYLMELLSMKNIISQDNFNKFPNTTVGNLVQYFKDFKCWPSSGNYTSRDFWVFFEPGYNNTYNYPISGQSNKGRIIKAELFGSDDHAELKIFYSNPARIGDFTDFIPLSYVERYDFISIIRAMILLNLDSNGYLDKIASPTKENLIRAKERSFQ